MATPALQSTVQKWQQRFGVAHSSGVPLPAIQQLANYDIQRVKSGSQPLTNQEVEDALNAQLLHTPVVQPGPKTGLANIPGNVSSDVGGILSGFIPGTINFVKHLPSELKQLGQDVSHPTFQGITHDPILSLFPGVYDLGQLSTPQGRAWMEAHPVSSMLDVLPLASSAGKAALAGRLASGGIEAGSAAEALARGSVVKAGIRAGTDSLSSVTSKILGRSVDLRSEFDKRLANLGLDAKTRELVARPFSMLTRQARATMRGVWDHKIEPLISGLTHEERQQLFTDATLHGGKAMNPEHQHILDSVRDYMSQLTSKAQTAKSLYGFVVPGGHKAIYSYNDPIAVRHRNLVSAKEKLEETALRLRDATSQTEINHLNSQVTKLRQKMVNQSSKFYEALSDSPDAAFHPKIKEMIRSRVADQIQQGNVAAGLQVTQETLDKIATTPNEQFLSSLLPEGEYDAIKQSATRMWLDLAQEGFSPIWVVHSTTEQMERAMFPKPLPDHKVTPEVFRRQLLNFAPGVEDIAAGVTTFESQVISEIVTEVYLNHLVDSNIVRSASHIYPEYERFVQDGKLAKNRLATQPPTEAARSLMGKEWETFDPERYGISSKVFAHRPNDLLIPKGTARAIDLMRSGYRFGGPEGLFRIGGAYDKALRVFRMSVLTGPRHFIHVAMGGLAFMTIKHPMAIRDINVKMLMPRVNPEHWSRFERSLPPELFGGLQDFSADQVYNFKAGQQLGGLWKNIASKAGDLHDKYVQWEERITAVQRAAVYLHNAPKLGHEKALHEAQKTFIDMEGMAPIERALMKNVIPFYPFMRHLFRYLFTLPVDNPYRTSILARFAQQEQEDWDTGLPSMYQSYLFLGQPDSSGNQIGIDTKNINPFRSFYNDFTLAGFVSAANPFFTSFGTAMGLNTLSASPQMFSAWDYNPVTGGKTTARPVNVGLSLVESFIPETQAIDSYIGASNRFKNLRQTNPAAFQRELFNYLNIPFATSKINIPLTEEKAEINRLQDAQNKVSEAMRTGDWSGVRRFNYVPYNGQLVPSNNLASYMESLQSFLKQYGITDPNAVIPRSSTSRPFSLL